MYTCIKIQWCISQTQQNFIMFISVIKKLDAQNFCFTISFFHASTCFEHMCSSSGGQNHTYRCDDTRGCVMQFWHPDDEHMCSKHVEAWNKLIVKQKFCASSWLITEVNRLRCTVSKTSNFIMFIIVLGQHVSILIESSSGPSKMQILT